MVRNFYTKATADAPPNLQLDAVPSRHVLYECNEMCACATSKCSNAVVRHGVRIPLRVQPVRDSPESPAGTKAQSSGLGVFAAAPIRKGQFICEYAGELISPTEARRRWSRQASQKQGNYILTIYETASSSAFEASEQELEEVSQLDPGSAPSLGGSRIDIDPREEGNVARFINHLCPPLANVVIAPVRCDGPLLLQTHSNAAKQPEIEPLSEYLHRLRISPLTNQNFPQSAKRLVPAPPRAALFAARDIAAGEQLGFDYADPTQLKGKTDVAALTSKPPSEGLQQQELRTRCLCGSVACRGWLPFDEQTDPAFPMD
ncbi:hypothetical protein OC861_001193 [Tilletia horrida]|nr:hypothetical protein OC845_001326 [Tilletia horrida]KAK0569157.1 hypothetical protein OC861_001193 [Tilletia horrida]